jgi:hypothetical protein
MKGIMESDNLQDEALNRIGAADNLRAQLQGHIEQVKAAHCSDGYSDANNPLSINLDNQGGERKNARFPQGC